MHSARAHLQISGLVQGVGYRFFTARKAGVYGLKGFVKNKADGRVEVIAEGDRGMLEEFIKELRVGPISAHVTDVRIEWEEPTYEFDGFHSL